MTKENQSVNIIHDKIKVHSLTGRITEDLMLKAFKAVKKNRGAAGIDKMTISMYEKKSIRKFTISNERTKTRTIPTSSSAEGTYSKRRW